MTIKTLDQHIEISPDVCGGRPRIAGRRITVQQIVICYDRLGKTPDEIAAEHQLELADIHAALAYYFDHQHAIDQAIRTSHDWIEELKAQNPSLVQEKLRRISTDG